MAMLKLSAYSKKDLQHLLQMVRQAMGAEITDLVDLERRLSGYLYREQTIRPRRHVKAIPCPSCGRGILVGPYQVEGLRIMRCSLKCGYSEAGG